MQLNGSLVQLLTHLRLFLLTKNITSEQPPLQIQADVEFPDQIILQKQKRFHIWALTQQKNLTLLIPNLS